MFKKIVLKLKTLLAHQNRTIAIASDFRVDEAKSPELPQKEWVLDSEIAARNRTSLAIIHRNLKSQCSIVFSPKSLAISGVRVGHHNRISQKSLRFRCAKKTLQIEWPSQYAEICRELLLHKMKVLEDFAGDSLEGLLRTIFSHKQERKNPASNSAPKNLPA